MVCVDDVGRLCRHQQVFLFLRHLSFSIRGRCHCLRGALKVIRASENVDTNLRAISFLVVRSWRKVFDSSATASGTFLWHSAVFVVMTQRSCVDLLQGRHKRCWWIGGTTVFHHRLLVLPRVALAQIMRNIAQVGLGWRRKWIVVQASLLFHSCLPLLDLVSLLKQWVLATAPRFYVPRIIDSVYGGQILRGKIRYRVRT